MIDCVGMKHIITAELNRARETSCTTKHRAYTGTNAMQTLFVDCMSPLTTVMVFIGMLESGLSENVMNVITLFQEMDVDINTSVTEAERYGYFLQKLYRTSR